MKKLLNVFSWASILALGMLSCTDKDQVDIPEVDGNNDFVNVSYDVIKPSNFIDVPVKEGYLTVVKQGNLTLLTTREATTLEVVNPQYSIFTRSTAPEVQFVYLPDDGSWNNASNCSGAVMYKTIMFEDRREDSDYDYNDLIIHVQQMRIENKLRIYIHPIAMGNYDDISLGADIFIVDSKGEGSKYAEVIFSNDVRYELFNKAAEKTYINTDIANSFSEGNGALAPLPTYYVKPAQFTSIKGNAKENGHWIEVDKSSISGKTFAINWFIINNTVGDNYKLYAVPAIKDNLVWRDPNGYPYGIISAKTRVDNWPLSDGDQAGHDWINYAQEKKHLKDVYPDFNKWLEGKANANWDYPIQENAVNAIGYIRGIQSLASGSNALYDISGCFDALGYDGKAIWRNGNPDESLIFTVERR